jgi:hypothetical protein
MTDNERKAPPETYSPEAWPNPDVQEAFGRALQKTGEKHKDFRLQRLGWLHRKAASEPKLKP